MADTAQPSQSLPHDLNAERAALGAVLLDPRALPVLQDLVAPTDFYSPAHRVIYTGMNTLSDANVPIDLTTLVNHLLRSNELESVGGAAYVASLEEAVFTTENVPQYARTIVDASRLRQLIEASDVELKPAE